MLIMITDRCTMGCSHCMSKCVPEGDDMSFSMFEDALDFSLTRMPMTPVMISGGEPTENPSFPMMVEFALDRISKSRFPVPLMIMSNGEWLSKNAEFLDEVEKRDGEKPLIQVVIDDRYYPRHVDESALRQYDCVKLCYDVNMIYPQGRALENGLSFNAKASKCFNVRAAVKQIHPKSLLELALKYSLPHQKYCSPNIDMFGNIRIGESFLCPICSSIYKTDEEIVEDIVRFSCHGCDFLNDKLPPQYRQFL